MNALRSLLVVMLAAACVHTQTTPLAGFAASRPPTCPDSVRIYSTPDAVGAGYQELALLHTSANKLASHDMMMKSLKKKAAAIGANGLILKGFTEAGKEQDQSAEATAIWVARDSLPYQGCATAP